MNRNKNIRNFTVIGICCYGIRLFWKPEIPNTISLVGGIIVAVIGLILIRAEQKTSNDEYYYGKRWWTFTGCAGCKWRLHTGYFHCFIHN